jgi:hypothetical protein
MSAFALSSGEKQSVAWRRLLEHMKRERDELREKNDSPKLDPVQTADVRGRIAQLTELIGLDAPTPGVDP